ncbi:MAG: hypothetical protein ABI036_18565 [Fibrobacteria bacterium]
MIKAFRLSGISAFITYAGAALFILCGCLAKEKAGKPLAAGGIAPPWDPAKFTPKRLEGYAYPGPESLFTLFGEIAHLDSMAGDPKDWHPDPEAVDTLGLAQLFDTAFTFPQNPEASMPYGYDDSFRDDTLFRNAYGNGLYTLDHPCAAIYVLSGQFLHPAKWLRNGLKAGEILAALGTPAYKQEGVLRYLSRHAPAAPDSSEGDTAGSGSAPPPALYDVYEGANFYFKADSLFAAVLQKSQPCH